MASSAPATSASNATRNNTSMPPLLHSPLVAGPHGTPRPTNSRLNPDLPRTVSGAISDLFQERQVIAGPKLAAPPVGDGVGLGDIVGI